MLIHGRLILTASGLNLDEVRSLLQKSLRRKDKELVTKSCYELIGRGKDQLPWKSIVTFLYEDHCLSDADVIKTIWECYENNHKYNAVELLLKAYTARYAACLPVVAIREEYHPSKTWDVNMHVDEELKGLVSRQSGSIDFDLLLAHIQKAWKEENVRDLISYMKLASMVQDYEDRSVTKKGASYLISSVACPNRAKGKPNPGLVILSMLYKVPTNSSEMKQYLFYSFKLASIPDVYVRLVICSAVTQLIHKDKVKKIADMTLNHIRWREVGRLGSMPEWAVDKHTFRGRNGRKTNHLVKIKPKGMTDEEFDNFHGERAKRGLGDFFDEGCIMTNETAPGENPYWEETKKVYYEQPPKLQKTYRLTKIMYQKMKTENKELFYISKSPKPNKTCDGVDKNETDEGVVLSDKRLTRSKKRRIAIDSATVDVPIKKSKTGLTVTTVKKNLLGATDQESSLSSDSDDSVSITEETFVPPSGPLLQLPTGKGKVYTRLSIDEQKVWKGPYSKKRMNMVLFFHSALRDVLKDPHTMQVECKEPYLVFPLLKDSAVSSPKIIKKDFRDAISGTDVKDGEFVLRESLGIVQCHKVGVNRLKEFPMTFWLHFIWRFCLNIGDSGLYNAVTDDKLSFLYGIDMEENRGRVAHDNLVDYMFTKRPAKPYVEEIWKSMRKNKSELAPLVTKPIKYASLDRLSQTYKVVTYDRRLFMQRIQLVHQVIQKL